MGKGKKYENRSRSRNRKGIKSTDFGLTIYAPESIGLPGNTMSGEELYELISNRTYTAKITNQDTDYFRVLEAVRAEKIEYINCFKTIEDTLYRKLRPGREMARSPPDRSGKIRKNSQ